MKRSFRTEIQDGKGRLNDQIRRFAPREGYGTSGGGCFNPPGGNVGGGGRFAMYDQLKLTGACWTFWL